jgi:hypothetical protein
MLIGVPPRPDADDEVKSAKLLKDDGGFRKYILVNASTYGVSGFIWRHSLSNIKLVIEGTAEDIRGFDSFLGVCCERKMVERISEVHAATEITSRRYTGFFIAKSRVSKQLPPTGGEFSEEDEGWDDFEDGKSQSSTTSSADKPMIGFGGIKK